MTLGDVFKYKQDRRACVALRSCLYYFACQTHVFEFVISTLGIILDKAHSLFRDVSNKNNKKSAEAKSLTADPFILYNHYP